jgi:hypothetical protein
MKRFSYLTAALAAMLVLSAPAAHARITSNGPALDGRRWTQSRSASEGAALWSRCATAGCSRGRRFPESSSSSAAAMRRT